MASDATRPDVPRRPSNPLIERGDHLAAIEAVLGHASVSPPPGGSIVVVDAEPGAGVTAVLDRVAATAASRWRTATVRADDHDAGVPFSVLHRVVDVLRSLPGAAQISDQRPALALAPVLDTARLLDGLDPAVEAPTLALGLGWLLERLTEDGPLLVVVDDAHLADDASLGVLTTAWSRCRLPMVLLVGAHPSPTPPNELERLRRAADTTLGLAPLTPAGTGQVLLQWGVTIGDGDLPGVHVLARGRPGDLEVLARARHGEPGAAMPLARSMVEPLLERRLGALTPPARRALEVIVVLDAVAEPSILGTVSRCPSRPEDCVAELRCAGLLTEDDPLRCSHPFVADAVLAGIAADDAGRLRRSMLAAAIDAGSGPEVLVPLALVCPPTADPVVVDLLAEAGDAAIRSREPARALVLLRRALREPPVAARENELRGQLALASAFADEPGAPALVRRAALQLDAVAGAHLARRASTILAGRGRAREAATMVDDLGRSLASTEPEVASILEMGWLGAAKTDLSMRPAVLRRVAEAATTDRFDPSPSGRALAAVVAYELSLLGEDRTRVVELARHAVDRRGGGSPTTDMPSIWSAVLALLFADELDDAAVTLDRLERRGIRRASEHDVLAAHHLRASIDRNRGLLESANRSAAVVADAVRHGWRGSVPGGAGNRCRLALLAGRLDRAEAELDLPGGVERYADDPSLVEYLDARGQLRLRQGRYAEALDDHLTVRDRHEVLGAVNPATMLWSQGAARAMAAMGRRADALDLLGEHLERARQWGAARPIGALLTTAGTLRSGRAGEELLEEAVDVLERGVTPIELADAHVALARAAQRRGDDRKSERAARRGALLADTAGAAAIAADARSVLGELADSGSDRTTVDRLTPAELRAARLAAGGASNADIAAELYVSRKAVEFHLSNVYRKLGVVGRRDLADALGEREG